MAASKPSEGKTFPSRIWEDQDMEMEPIKLGTPAYSSDDPTTDGLRMLPLEDGTSASTAHDAAAELRNKDAEELKAAEWVEFVNNAEDQDALDAVASQYEESGSNYATVEKAIEKKQAELDDE